jgi:hypothetical protein
MSFTSTSPDPSEAEIKRLALELEQIPVDFTHSLHA